jgi:putative tryptophan/tyrosine transport system substrate-binding protein
LNEAPRVHHAARRRGGAAAWPLVVSAQQPAMPVIGFLSVTSAHEQPHWLAAFHRGLSEAGYVEGQNVSIEYRWAEGRYDQLPELAADLVRRQVRVIAVPASNPGALAAKAATSTIPIVFSVGDDPVKLHLVASLAHPGGNATGINLLVAELATKRFGLVHEMVPGAARVAVLVNPANTASAEATLKGLEETARATGLQLQVLNASTLGQINEAFESIARERVEALLVAPDSFFATRRVQFAILAARHRVPVIFSTRDFPAAGGLMSYGTDIVDAYRWIGIYAGRILKGAKPADLPVLQSTKFELVINLQTARVLGVDVPPTLLASADEVIE